MKTKFEINKVYRGVSGIGSIDLEVVKRTEKTIWVKTSFGVNSVRVKNYSDTEEMIFFKSWCCGASDIYTKEQMEKDAYHAAYEI